MGSYFPLDTTLCSKPDGRTPAWAFCIVIQGATTAATAKNLYADIHGRTHVMREEYAAQQSTFKRGAASDVAERRFTDEWVGKDTAKQQKRIVITQALIDKTLMLYDLEKTTAEYRVIHDYEHQDPVIAAAMTAAMASLEAAVVAQSPDLSTAAIKTELAAVCWGMAENCDKMVLFSAMVDKKAAVSVIQTTITDLQTEMKTLDAFLTEVSDAWKDYQAFLHGGGDPAANPYHWFGFASVIAAAAAAELQELAAAAAAADEAGCGGPGLPHPGLALPPVEKTLPDPALQVTAVPRSVEQMLEWIDMKIADPARAPSNTLSPVGGEDRSNFAVRMTWLTFQMGKVSYKKDNDGSTAPDGYEFYINHKGFTAMSIWMNLDHMEQQRFYSWIGLGKSDELTQEEVRSLPAETYWRQNVLQFLLEREVRPALAVADSDASQVFV